MDTVSVNYLITAKTEYEKKLLIKLCPNIFKYFKSLYHNAEIMCNEENNPENILMLFQYNLERISKWKPTDINRYYQKFIKEQDCSYFADLVKIIFITHIRILTLLGHNGDKLNIEIPSPGKFMHLAYLEAARSIWQLPYLFYNSKQNIQYINDIIEKSIISVIQTLIPINEIIKSCNLEQFNIKDFNKKVKEDLKVIIPQNNKEQLQIDDKELVPDKKEEVSDNKEEVLNNNKSKTLKRVSFAKDDEVIKEKTKTLKRPLNLSKIDDLKLDEEFNNSSIKEIFLTDGLEPKNINEVLFNSLPTKKSIDNPKKPLFYDQLNLPDEDITKTLQKININKLDNDIKDNDDIKNDVNDNVKDDVNENEKGNSNDIIEKTDDIIVNVKDNVKDNVNEDKDYFFIPKIKEDKNEFKDIENEVVEVKENEIKDSEVKEYKNKIKDIVIEDKESIAEKIENDNQVNELNEIKEVGLTSSVNLNDLISDINEINLDNILNTTNNEKKTINKTISPNKFTFFKDATFI